MKVFVSVLFVFVYVKYFWLVCIVSWMILWGMLRKLGLNWLSSGIGYLVRLVFLMISFLFLISVSFFVVVVVCVLLWIRVVCLDRWMMMW